MDFMNNALTYGHRFRTQNVLDDYNRQALATEVDTSLKPERVITWRGKPRQIRGDNGPEFTLSALEGL